MKAQIASKAPPLVLMTILALCLGSCSGSGGSVATVGDVTISKSSFQHWYELAARYHAEAMPGEEHSVLPDPPSFSRCVAAQLPKAGSVSAQQMAISKRQLRETCAGEAREDIQLAMTYLIEAAWEQAQAKALGVSVSDAEVEQRYQSWRQEQYPADAQLKEYFKRSGKTKQDVLLSLRTEALRARVLAKVTSAVRAPSAAAVARYYRKHRRQFKPVAATRTTEILTAADQGHAQAARGALAQGMDFTQAVKRFSLHGDGGGTFPITKDSADPQLVRAVFASTRGGLVGPLKSAAGWQVGRVLDVASSAQATFAGYKQLIEGELTRPQTQRLLSSFEAHYRSHWKSLTRCNPGYVVSLCSNGGRSS